jgi:iron complex outermembrane receptor protein
MNRLGRAQPRGAQLRNRRPVVRRRLLLAPALLAALLAWPTAVRGDPRSEAKLHYREGMALIAAGQIEKGIAELQAAYAIKPHANVLYNIARAYVDLGNIPEALRFFERYVATEPEDKAAVEAVMGRLASAIAPGADNKKREEAKGAPASGKGAAAAAQGGTELQGLLAQLTALLAQQRSGAAGPRPVAQGGAATSSPQEPEEEGTFAAVEVTALAKATAKEIAAGLEGDRSGDELFEELVVTAGVRASAESRAPASLTVITEEEIRLSGAVTIPELLRRVPGIDVAEMNPSDVNVSIRGFNRRVANKVLVLVDGRPVFQDSLGNTLWPLLDVAIPEIARIEVIRGPGSALYGANAFAGVVNVITKAGQKGADAAGEAAAGPRFFTQLGERHTVLAGLTTGGKVDGKSGQLTWRTSLAYDRADKWTRDQPDDSVATTPQLPQPDRSREVERAAVTAGYDAGRFQVSAGGGFDHFASEVFPLGALRSFGISGESGFARLEVAAGQTRVRGYWNALRMGFGPEYAPDGLLPLSSSLRSDAVDLSVQSGADFRWHGEHRLNYGVGWKVKSVDWGYLERAADGTHRFTEHHFDLFLQEEWQLSKSLSLVVGWRLDRHPLLARWSTTPGGLVQSPRATVLWEAAPDQVLRFTFGTAFRVPSFLESYIDLLAPVPNQPALAIRFRGDQRLQPEQIVQGELGWRGRLGERLRSEVVLYAERVSDLISEGALARPGIDQQRDPATGALVIGLTGFQNDPQAYLGLGAELGLKWSASDQLELSANYSLEKIADCTDSCTFDAALRGEAAAALGNTATHKLNLTALYRGRSGFDLSADVHLVSAVNWVEKTFDPTAPGGVMFVTYPLDGYALVNARAGWRLFKDQLELAVAGFNLLGDDHREHPFGNRIGRRVSLLASGSF